jgi:hypothetical protein
MIKRRDIIPNPLREPYASIVDRVMERDRAWFDANPGARSYRRQYIPGEFNSDALAEMGVTPLGQDCVIEVTELAPGIRTRQILVPWRPQ